MDRFFKSNGPALSYRPARMAPLAAAVLAIFLMAACGTHEEEMSEQKSAILYGEASPPEENAVLALRAIIRQTDTPDYTKPSNDSSLGYCTAVLIAPNVAMTARHCVSYVHGSEGSAFTCSPAGVLEGDKDTGLYPRLANVKMDRAVSREEVQVGPCIEGFDRCDAVLKRYVVDIAVPETKMGETPSICRDDIALLKLETPILPEQAVPAMIRLDPLLAEGDVLKAVGHGLTQTPSTSGLRQRKNVKVLAVGPGTDIADEYPAAVRTFVNDGPSQCEGDSGGPTFSSKGGVVGIYSHRSGECDEPSGRKVSTHVARHRAFIEATLKAWGATVKAEEFEGGDPCTVDDFCKSASCVSGKCAIPCDAKGACASGLECKGKACIAKAAVPPPVPTSGGGEGTGSCAVQRPGHGSSSDGSPAKLVAAWFTCVFFVASRRRARTSRTQRL